MRLSYGKNPFTNGLEILEENDYYPFGMNHLRTGTSYFGAGSWMNYKYNGKELQETRMYAMDWRQYMPDIARFGVQDAFAAIIPDWTPYRFAFNNPI